MPYVNKRKRRSSWNVSDEKRLFDKVISSSIAKRVMPAGPTQTAIRRAILKETETKRFLGTTAVTRSLATADYDGITFNPLYFIGQGVGTGARIGDKIHVMYIDVTFTMTYVAAQAAFPTTHRLSAFMHDTRTAYGVVSPQIATSVENFYTPGSLKLCGLNWDLEKVKMVKTMYKHRESNNQSAQFGQQLIMRIPINKVVQYDGVNSGYLKGQQLYIRLDTQFYAPTPAAGAAYYSSVDFNVFFKDS